MTCQGIANTIQYHVNETEELRKDSRGMNADKNNKLSWFYR
jgi:hypothetical protein